MPALHTGVMRFATVALLVIAFAAPTHAAVTTAPGGGTPGTSSNFQLVGQDPLFFRGMNAALAIYDHYVYVGNRTDGSNRCGATDPRGAGTDNCPHTHPGVLIVDVADPANPRNVGEIGPPYEGLTGITSRELRVWPQQKLLVVMNFRCSSVLHSCPPGNDVQFPYDLKFFDLTDPVHPRYISNYVPTSAAGRAVKPHEMFLWIDPKNANRGLLYISTPTLSTTPTLPNLMVVDISNVAKGGKVTEVAEGNWNSLYPGTSDPTKYPLTGNNCGPYDCNLIVHSMALNEDGTRAYLSMEAGHMLVLDTSDIANGAANPQLRLLTDPKNRPTWLQTPPDPAAVPANCPKDCPNGHSAVQVPGRPFVLTTDEVYGTFTDPSQGCPWGWMRMINVSDAAHPSIVGEYRLQQNELGFCGSPGDDTLTEKYTSYSSHNPTVLRDVALIAWHSGGMQAIDISDAANPKQGGWFSPSPLPYVATEDPALGSGPNKVIMWSYPIVRDGLIYVVDIRNGLYILRYTGPFATEVAGLSFFEGNSNLGSSSRPAGVSANGNAGGFTVSFTSQSAGTSRVLFGPSCSALVMTATQDLGAGTTTHSVVVTGNDLPGTVGNIGITPGATYYYAIQTVTGSGVQTDNNGGACYRITIPASGSSVQARTLTTSLTGAAETPAGAPTGQGTASISLDTGSNQVCWTITASGVTLPAVAAHIHQAPAGTAGPVVIPLSPPGAGGTSSGCTSADPTLIQNILANPANFYVNVHTQEFPAGALRGQLG